MLIKTKLCDITFCTGYEKPCKRTRKDCVWWDTKKKKCRLREIIE
jgi:hypothetical protein